MSRLLFIMVIVLFIWYEREFIAIALTPIIDITVCIIFILVVLVVLMCEIALIVVAPVALLLGIDSRQWHTKIAKKITLFGGKKDES